MIAPRWSRYSPIGVDFGSRFVKAMQLRRHHGGWRVSATAMYQRTGEELLDDDAVAQLRQVLVRRGFVGRRIVFALPHSHVKSNLLDLPAGDGAVAPAQLSRMEMARIHHMPPDAFELACWPVPAPKASTKGAAVMAHACPHQQADELLDLFEGGGLEIAALDLHACALARAAATKLPTGNQFTLITDLGWRRCQIVAMRGRVIAYERSVDEVSLAAIHDRVAELLGGDDEAADHVIMRVGPAGQSQDDTARADLVDIMRQYTDAIADEVRACVRYMQQQYPDADQARLLLTGGGADLAGLADRATGALQIETQTVAPASLADCPQEQIEMCSPSMMTTALGLARHAASD